MHIQHCTCRLEGVKLSIKQTEKFKSRKAQSFHELIPFFRLYKQNNIESEKFYNYAAKSYYWSYCTLYIKDSNEKTSVCKYLIGHKNL